MHFQRFGEALRGVQEKLAEKKKFYMNDMNCNNVNYNNSNNNHCDCGCN